MDDTAPAKTLRERFWERHRLAELSPAEWEALCDGCGQCCLVREVDEQALTVFAVACDLLDIAASRCGDYPNRLRHVPECTRLTPERVAQFTWLPGTCAYRRLHLGRPLPAWHPLLTGSRDAMERGGFTVRAYARHQREVPEDAMPDHILAVWPLPQARRAARSKRRHR